MSGNGIELTGKATRRHRIEARRVAKQGHSEDLWRNGGAQIGGEQRRSSEAERVYG